MNDEQHIQRSVSPIQTFKNSFDLNIQQKVPLHIGCNFLYLYFYYMCVLLFTLTPLPPLGPAAPASPRGP